MGFGGILPRKNPESHRTKDKVESKKGFCLNRKTEHPLAPTVTPPNASKNDGSGDAFVRKTLALAFNRRLHAAALSSTVLPLMFFL
jgi:hypothetical protein